ncbi:GntR family transcriptional regulator [Sinorhizobium chiapasense]|uniref:GntR family transcriptional regulator n=1 Tax=Sinorhizobium chiapasense TaxID=501572 RepID=A0ABZ2BI61_9HYPH
MVKFNVKPKQPKIGVAEAVDPLPKHSSLGDAAYRSLKQSIVSGAFPIGEKLTIRAIAAALETSTTPARDAVNRLLAEGALVNEGPKTVVIPPLTELAMDELLHSRLALEGMAAERAAPHLTSADCKTLAKLQTTINENLDSKHFKDVLNANWHFHFLIYNRSGWERVVQMIDSLWLRAGPSMHGLYPEFAESKKGVRHHYAIIAAAEKRDPKALRFAVEADIRDGCTQILVSLQRSLRLASVP